MTKADPYDDPRPAGCVRVCPICSKIGVSEVFDVHMEIAHPGFDWATDWKGWQFTEHDETPRCFECGEIIEGVNMEDGPFLCSDECHQRYTAKEAPQTV